MVGGSDPRSMTEAERLEYRNELNKPTEDQVYRQDVLNKPVDRHSDGRGSASINDYTKEGSDPLQLYEHDIRRFVDAMKYKLRKNAHKGRWESYDHDKALALLEKEVDELREALREGNMVEIMLEAADVANFAMMIAVMSIER